MSAEAKEKSASKKNRGGEIERLWEWIQEKNIKILHASFSVESRFKHTYDIKAKVGLFRKKRKLVVWKRVVRNSNKEVKAGKIQYYVIEIS